MTANGYAHLSAVLFDYTHMYKYKCVLVCWYFVSVVRFSDFELEIFENKFWRKNDRKQAVTSNDQDQDQD